MDEPRPAKTPGGAAGLSKSLQNKVTEQIGRATGYEQYFSQKTSRTRGDSADDPIAQPELEKESAAPTKPSDFWTQKLDRNDVQVAAEQSQSRRRAGQRALLKFVLIFGGLLLLTAAAGAAVAHQLQDPSVPPLLFDALNHARGVGAVGTFIAALFATSFVVILIATARYEPRRLARAEWAARKQSDLDHFIAHRRTTYERTRVAREMLEQARLGRDGAAEIRIGRLARAVAVIAFPLTLLPLLLMLLLQMHVPTTPALPLEELSNATASVTQTIAVLAQPVTMYTNYTNLSLPLYLPPAAAATSIASPFSSLATGQLDSFMRTIDVINDGLIGDLFKFAYVGLAIVVWIALWAVTWATAVSNGVSGAIARSGWEHDFRRTWETVLKEFDP